MGLFGFPRGPGCLEAAVPCLHLRPGELRAAEWPEFDIEAAVWTIPAERTKMRRPHRVPLPTQTLAVLAEVSRAITGRGKYVFPGGRSAARCLSENAFNAALRRMGFAKHEATSHGFRSSFSTIANQVRPLAPGRIERALAHVEGNSVRRAYARGEHWDERVRLAQWWADECDRMRLDFDRQVSLAKPL